MAFTRCGIHSSSMNVAPSSMSVELSAIVTFMLPPERVCLRDRNMVIVYDKDFGVKLPRRDRYNGNPSWLESSIREYELGPLGPRHECETRCDCIACGRLRWLQRIPCRCELRLEWWKTMGIDDAMRRKMLRCRCSPFTVQYIHESLCTCLSTPPTEECVPCPLSELSLPSEFEDSFDGGTRSGPVCGVSCFEDVMRMLRRIDRHRIGAVASDDSTGHTEVIVHDGPTEIISGGSHSIPRLRCDSAVPAGQDLEDTADSSTGNRKRPWTSSQ